MNYTLKWCIVAIVLLQFEVGIEARGGRGGGRSRGRGGSGGSGGSGGGGDLLTMWAILGPILGLIGLCLIIYVYVYYCDTEEEEEEPKNMATPQPPITHQKSTNDQGVPPPSYPDHQGVPPPTGYPDHQGVPPPSYHDHQGVPPPTGYPDHQGVPSPYYPDHQGAPPTTGYPDHQDVPPATGHFSSPFTVPKGSACPPALGPGYPTPENSIGLPYQLSPGTGYQGTTNQGYQPSE